jgi:hypothetical protein
MKLGMKAAVAVGYFGVLGLGAVPAGAADPSCSLCGPGPDWIDSCAAGSDAIGNQRALVGIDTDLDCNLDMNLILDSCGTDFIVNRGSPAGGTIPTEIIDLCLTDGNATLIAGAGLGNNGVLQPSVGTIVEQVADNTKGDSTFGVMFEFDLGGGNFVYNHTPLVVSSEITCVPPQARYIHPTGCTPLFDDPVGGTLVANLVSANHDLVPAVSEWGVAAMVLLVLAAGTVVIRRCRRVPA